MWACKIHFLNWVYELMNIIFLHHVLIGQLMQFFSRSMRRPGFSTLCSKFESLRQLKKIHSFGCLSRILILFEADQILFLISFLRNNLSIHCVNLLKWKALTACCRLESSTKIIRRTQ